MSNLRRIEPVNMAGLNPVKPETGAPIFEMVDPKALYVDGRYQRGIADRGLRQIRRIIEQFDWAKFKAPTVCYAENEAGETCLFVLDGQHTAIAAASNPYLTEIPVQIVEASTIESQAGAFIGLNRDRLNVTPMQLHHAAVAAGDEDAITIEQVCERAGITILRHPPHGGEYKPCETVAINAIAGLINRRHAMGARQILEVLARAECAPIKAAEIKAAELLLTDPQFSDHITHEDLTVTISGDFEDEAKLFAATHKIAGWEALARVWFQHCKKRRKSA
jgi:hypothetical protein